MGVDVNERSRGESEREKEREIDRATDRQRRKQITGTDIIVRQRHRETERQTVK